jgi:formylmethanofuran dehydrogenase subunit D
LAMPIGAWREGVTYDATGTCGMHAFRPPKLSISSTEPAETSCEKGGNSLPS